MLLFMQKKQDGLLNLKFNAPESKGMLFLLFFAFMYFYMLLCSANAESWFPDVTRKFSSLEAGGVIVWDKPEILCSGIY